MGKFLIFIAFCLMSHSLLAQSKGKIWGTVADNNTALEFVTIALTTAADTTKPIQVTTTDSVGYFLIDNLEPGTYQLKLSLIGYAPVVKNFLLGAGKIEQDFSTIRLNKDEKFLQVVTVTAQKKLIEKTPNGFIVNAAANLTATGGTATDILKNTPTVSVDAEGAITLRGKTPLILINGRNSNLSNPDQIPASSIESLEIINNPNAKYDANAETGIINIKLKKNNLAGTNGAIALGAGYGSRGRVNSSLLLNHKTNKWNFGLGYDNRFAGRTRKINGSRTNYNLPDDYLILQDRNDERLEQMQNLKMNIDFAPNRTNLFSFEAIGNMDGQDNDESLNSIIYKQNNDINSNTNRHSIEIEREKVAEFAFDYNRKFKDERKSLTTNITTSIERNRQNTDITSQDRDNDNIAIGDSFLQKTHNYENGNITTARIDYTFPAFGNGGIETGYKGTFRSVNTDYQSSDLVDNDYIINTAASNIFDFKEQVHAAYLVYKAGFGKVQKWKYDLGLRAEQAYNNGDTKDKTTDFTNQYLKFFPSASLNYFIQPEAYWKLSYGKKINRPGLEQLNPFVDITDSLNPHSGNPNLQPEIIHAFELGYNKEWNNYGLSANLFYRYALNTIRQYFHLQDNGANLIYPENIGNASTYGIESILSGKISKSYDFNASLSLFQQKLNGSNISEDAVQKAFGWYGKLINNIVPWQGAKLQITGNYNSAIATPQGRRIAQYFADLGFQQKLGKRNARLGLTITDIFNTFKSGYENSTTEFSNYRYGKADTRAFIITFAWFFRSAFKEKLLENKFSTDY